MLIKIPLVSVGDRVTFQGDHGLQAGYVADLRRDIGNGEPHAWVEIDNEPPGIFIAMPVAMLIASDGLGGNQDIHALTSSEVAL